MSSFFDSAAARPSASVRPQPQTGKSQDRRRHSRNPAGAVGSAGAPSVSAVEKNPGQSRIVQISGDATSDQQSKRSRNRNRSKRDGTAGGDVSRSEAASSARADVVAESPSKKHRAEAIAKPAAHNEQAETAAEAPALKDDVLTAYMTSEQFSNLSICAESKRAIAEVMKFNFMTHVQATCIGPIQQGLDCLAKSKTGTG